MPANPIPLTVSQEVREAAADLAASLGFGVFGAMIRDGSADNHRLVQRVARFEADCAARFVEKLRALRSELSSLENCEIILDEAITAIQEPRP